MRKHVKWLSEGLYRLVQDALKLARDILYYQKKEKEKTNGKYQLMAL